MKKKLFIIFIVLFVLALIYTIFNQFDIKKVKSEFFGKSANDIFGKPDYSKSNGYYRLFSLAEPEDVDIESDEVYMRYRKLHDPKYDNKKFVIDSKKWNKSDFNKKYKKFLKKHKNAKNWFLSGIDQNIIGRCDKILKDKEDVIKLKTLSKTYLERYQKLIESNIFEDITNLNPDLSSTNINDSFYSPIPNLLQWLRLGKIYNIIHTLDAMEGNWESGIKNLIVHIGFLRKGQKTNKILITNLINKALIQLTIRSINDLLNNKDCPEEMYELVLKMPDLNHEEYGSRRSFIAETVLGPSGRFFYDDIFNRKSENVLEYITKLFLHNNRTLNVYDEHVKNLLYFDKTPPYLWKKEFKLIRIFKNGFFWWLQNPIGKQFLDTFIRMTWPNLKRVIANSYELKAMFDMLKISAELRLKYTGEKPVKDILKTLDTYNSLIDLCSGNPYKWNKKKEILYSIGIDRKDNNGVYSIVKLMDNDYSLPITLFVR